ncbi:hypothetical protein SUGI_1055830 [Cryptomeria japonica]|nr:hypothetical protein SUGI_1055830 [Cryptomeria japonica]
MASQVQSSLKHGKPSAKSPQTWQAKCKVRSNMASQGETLPKNDMKSANSAQAWLARVEVRQEEIKGRWQGMCKIRHALA